MRPQRRGGVAGPLSDTPEATTKPHREIVNVLEAEITRTETSPGLGVWNGTMFSESDWTFESLSSRNRLA